MISCGELANLAEARKVIRESFPIKTYQPAPIHQLDEIDKQFAQLTSGTLGG